MDKYIYDKNNGLWYELKNDYYIPCLTLPEKKREPIGIWGQRHKAYLKERRKASYTTMLMEGKLNSYLAAIDKQAKERLETLVEQMKQAQGITEQLKAENALEWIGRMNNIRASAIEIVNREIIYAYSSSGTSALFCRSAIPMIKKSKPYGGIDFILEI